MRRCRIFALVAVALAAVAHPAAATEHATATLSLVTRHAAAQAAGAHAAVFDLASSSPRVIPAGDLDGDGLGDLVVASVVETGSTRAVDVQAVSAQGAGLWSAGPFPLTLATRTSLDRSVRLSDGVVTIATHLRFDEAGRDVLVSYGDPITAMSSVLALNGTDGAELWRHSVPAATGPGGVQAGSAIVLDEPGDVDLDGFDDVLVGRYAGWDLPVDDPSGRGRWALDAWLVSGRTGRQVGANWQAAGAGMAPTAALIAWDTWSGIDVVVADAVRTPTEGRAVVRAYAGSLVGVPAVERIFTRFEARAPANRSDLALSLGGLPVDFTAGGIAVGFDAAVAPLSLEDASLRGQIAGPATLVGLGRGGLVRFSITLPSGAIVQRPGDVNGDRIEDVRTVRVDGDSLVTETWSGHGDSVSALPAHQMTFLEGDDYEKTVDVQAGMGDTDGDGIRELLIGAGYPCGPRYQVLGGATGAAKWGRPEIRAMGCYGRLFPLGASVGGAAEDVLEWNTQWVCCNVGLSPRALSVAARNGTSGATLWSIEVPDVAGARSMHGSTIADVTEDGIREVVVALTLLDGSDTYIVALDGANGTPLWTF